MPDDAAERMAPSNTSSTAVRKSLPRPQSGASLHWRCLTSKWMTYSLQTRPRSLSTRPRCSNEPGPPSVADRHPVAPGHLANRLVGPGGGLGGDRLAISDAYRSAAELLEDRAHNGVRERVEHAGGLHRLAFNLQSVNAVKGATEPAANLISDCIEIGKRAFESKVGLVDSHAKGINHAALWTSTRLTRDRARHRQGLRPRRASISLEQRGALLDDVR